MICRPLRELFVMEYASTHSWRCGLLIYRRLRRLQSPWYPVATGLGTELRATRSCGEGFRAPSLSPHSRNKIQPTAGKDRDRRPGCGCRWQQGVLAELLKAARQ